MTKAQIEQLRQLSSITWDGDLISKTDRDWLVTCGYAFRIDGWNGLTKHGVQTLVNMKLLQP